MWERIIQNAAVIALVAILGAAAGCGSNNNAGAVPQSDPKLGGCSATSSATLNACRSEADDDYWLAIAICNNVDPDERLTCQASADAIHADEMLVCRDVFFARQDVCAQVGEAPYRPDLTVSNFVNPADIGNSVAPNPYFPLVVGNTWVYEGDGETVTVTVLPQTKEILGIETVVVLDLVEDEKGQKIEETFDWFAQHVNGDVWYMGEISLNYEDGDIRDIDGSWRSGVDGAQPGILIRANPVLREVLRQEFDANNAEDLARADAFDANVSSPALSCMNDCLQTYDFTPLDAESQEAKYYKPGIGKVRIDNLIDGSFEELISFTVN